MDGDFSSHQDDFKTCSYHFQFSLHVSVREKFNALCEIQFSNLFINNNWSLKSILDFVLQQLPQFLFIITICEQFQIYWYSEILSSWWSQEEWLKKKSKSIANLCFCNQSDVRDEDTCLQLMKKHQLSTFVSGSFSHVSLWEIQFNSYPGANPVDLAWINLMHLNHSELHFICEMRIMKARSWGSCKD